MAVQKPLQINPTTGRPRQVAAVESSAGAGDEGKIVALNASGKIDSTMMPADYDPEGLTQTMTASENIAAGDLVNIWDDAGTLKVRKADSATATKEADGFCDSAITSGASGSVHLGSGQMTKTAHGIGLSLEVFLSVTGGITATPPTSGILQHVGQVIDANTIKFTPGEVIEL